jgi:hypothetical protein
VIRQLKRFGLEAISLRWLDVAHNVNLIPCLPLLSRGWIIQARQKLHSLSKTVGELNFDQVVP